MPGLSRPADYCLINLRLPVPYPCIPWLEPGAPEANGCLAQVGVPVVGAPCIPNPLGCNCDAAPPARAPPARGA